MKEPKIHIGISQCLTNSIVRYDAKNKFNEKLISSLEDVFIIESICPEVESGMSVPRPAVNLVDLSNKIKVLGRDDKFLDVTEQLVNYSKSKVLLLSHLSGYIFKARSPSCGVATTPIFNSMGEVEYYSNGTFVDSLLSLYPNMPVIDDAEIGNEEIISTFIENVKMYSKSVSEC